MAVRLRYAGPVRPGRDPVRLQEALEVAHDEGFGTLVEAGPHPRMASAARALGLRGVSLGHGDIDPAAAAHGAFTGWIRRWRPPRGSRAHLDRHRPEGR